MKRRQLLCGLAALPSIGLWSLTALAQSAPRFVDLAGARPDSRQIVELLKQQSSVGRTRTRKLNLEPMLAADAGAAADSTPRETLVVKTESPRLSFDQITFEFDSAKISREAIPVLREIGTALKTDDLREYRFLIEGHTDSTGALQYNMRLSARRADSVKRYLISRHGLTAKRLLTAGKGPTDPVNTDDTKNAINRRVVLMAFESEAAPA